MYKKIKTSSYIIFGSVYRSHNVTYKRSKFPISLFTFASSSAEYSNENKVVFFFSQGRKILAFGKISLLKTLQKRAEVKSKQKAIAAVFFKYTLPCLRDKQEILQSSFRNGHQMWVIFAVRFILPSLRYFILKN